jgi:hypothetical protein
MLLVADKYEDNIHIAICSFTTALVIELRNELYIIVCMSRNSLRMFIGRKVVSGILNDVVFDLSP